MDRRPTFPNRIMEGLPVPPDLPSAVNLFSIAAKDAIWWTEVVPQWRSEFSFTDTVQSVPPRNGDWDVRRDEPLWCLPHFHTCNLVAGLYLDDRDIVAVRVADTNILAVLREGHPIRPIARAHAPGDLLSLEVVDIEAIVQQTRHPKFLLIRTKRQPVRERGGGFEWALSRLEMLGRYFHSLNQCPLRDGHNDESVQTAQSHIHPAPI